MTQPLTFCFKGNRNYIQGPDIVSAFLTTQAESNLTNLDLKFNGITSNGLDLIEGKAIKNAPVNIRCIVNGEPKNFQLVDNGQTIDCRNEYDESSVVNQADLELDKQTVTLKKSTGFTLCENFVALNKYLLQSLFPDEPGKWYFTRLEQSRIVSNDELITVKLIKNFNFRLTKSDILINDEVIGSVYFTMVKEKS